MSLSQQRPWDDLVSKVPNSGGPEADKTLKLDAGSKILKPESDKVLHLALAPKNATSDLKENEGSKNQDVEIALALIARTSSAMKMNEERIRQLEARVREVLARATEVLNASEGRVQAAEARLEAAQARAEEAEARAQESDRWLGRLRATIVENFASLEDEGLPRIHSK